MNKREFLDVLRQALDGEVSPDIIEQNIKYYDNYITTNSIKDEETILNELGHPRLIAKTIIESEKIAREKGKSTGYRGYNEEYSDRRYPGEEEQEEQVNGRNYGTRRRSIFFQGVRWYHKVFLWVILISFLLLLLFIGRVIIRLLYVFAVPIILMVLLLSLFRRR